MQSPDNHATGRDAGVKALWLLLAVALNALEYFIPRIPFLPWLKPGIANSITIIWIIRYGTTDALLYTLIRVWISSFYFGFSLVTMGLALSGGILSTMAMGLLVHLSRRSSLRFGTVGIGIAGALTHNAGQLAAVFLLLTRNNVLFYQLPFMGIAALLFGGLTGIITPVLWRLLTSGETPLSAAVNSGAQVRYTGSPTRTAAAIAALAGALSIIGINSLPMLAGIAFAATIVAMIAGKGCIGAFFYPVRFWLMFLFIGLVYLFCSNGVRIAWLPLITYEGAFDTARQCLRLWTWIEAGVLLQRLECNQLLFAALKKLFPRHAPTLLAGLVALELFPGVLSFVKSRKAFGGLPWRNPVSALALFIGRVQQFIAEQNATVK